MSDLYDYALAAHDAGLCVVPAKSDGSKRPWPGSGSWEKFKSERPTPEQLAKWFDNEPALYDGFGVVCGAVSGGLEMLELEGRAVDAGIRERIEQAAESAGLIDLLDRIADGYEETTPSGGIHWLYRCVEPANQKLARSAGGECLIETKGEGGFVIVAPSGGRTHPSGRNWERNIGGFNSIAIITADERHALLDLCRTFDEVPPQPFEPSAPAFSGDPHERPGDDFVAKTTWHDVLAPHGWVNVGTSGEHGLWRRPGKSDGVSATTNHAGSDLLCVFSTSTPFEPNRGYNRFSAYAILAHNGDFATAARELGAKGYGRKPEPPKSRKPDNGAPVVRPTTVDPDTGEILVDVREVDDVEPAAPAEFEDGDIDNGRRLVAAFGDDIRYVPEWGKWIRWTGKLWQKDTTGEIERLAKHVVGGIETEAANAPDEGRRKLLYSWYKKSKNMPRVKAMIEAAQSEPGISVSPDELNADPYLLNVANGVIDLRTGGVREHRRSDLITRIIDVEFNTGAEAPLWDGFLERIIPDSDLRAWLQRAVGYSITGDVSEQVMFFAHGGGANGKSTLLGTFSRIFGTYGTTMQAKTLTDKGDTNYHLEIAKLQSRRFVISAEAEQNRVLAESLVKWLTGGDTLTARYQRQDFFDFEPTHKIWMHANHKPRVSGTDEGIWRRIRLIPFNVRIPEDERDPELMDKLAAEYPGILAWAVRGAVLWSQHRLGTVAAVDLATDDYRLNEDHVGRFLAEWCETGPEFSVPISEFYNAYRDWAAAVGERPRADKTIGDYLTDHGFSRGRGGKGRTRIWEGLRLIPNSPEMVFEEF